MKNEKVLEQAPTIGLCGSFEGTCVKCLQPTDTGFGTLGKTEWHIAMLIHLGFDVDEAIELLNQVGADTGMVRGGTFQVVTRLCQSCTDAHDGDIRVALLVTGAEVPNIVSGVHA